MDIVQEVSSVEDELLTLIVQHLEENKLEPAKAQQLARDFLAILPVADQHELLQKLKELGGTYAEAQILYIEELAKIDEMKKDDVLNHMRSAIKNGDIENAISVAKAYTEKKKEG
jgi:hypothetical protein